MKARDLKEHFCNPVHISAAVEVGAPDNVVEERKSYCRDLDSAVISEVLETADSQRPATEDRVDELLIDHPDMAALYEQDERLANAPGDQGSLVFTELARGAGTPEDLFGLASRNISRARQQGGSPIWELGRDTQQKRYPLASLPEAQSVALWLYICERFDGCREGQLIRMMWCGTSRFGGPCPAGASVEDMLYLTTSPADWMLAMEILQRLRTP